MCKGAYMRIIATDLITDNMKLARPVYVGNCLILKKGSDKLTRHIRSLLNMKVRYLCVEDDQSEGIEIPETISDESRLVCKERLETTIQDLKQKRQFNISGLNDCIEEIMDQVHKNSEVQISLLDLNSTDEYTMTHCVNTMIYSVVMAKEQNLSSEIIKELSLGTLLHDIGKSFLQHDVIFKDGRLSDPEFEYIKQHPRYGYHIIKNLTNISKASKDIVLHHHEKLDGTGYPDGLKGDEISRLARIAAISDVYDALTTDRCYRKKWTTAKALDFLMQNAGNHFDISTVHSFMQLIAVYPTGSTVRLSDNRLAIVAEQNHYTPLRPIVRIITNEYGEYVTPYELNLMDILSITIIESEIEVIQSNQSVSYHESQMFKESQT